MKTTAEKSQPAAVKTQQPFFPGKGPGGFFAPAVQAKLEVNTPGDEFEKEADVTAEKVMRADAPAIKEEEKKIQRKPVPEEEVQRACADCGEKEEPEEKPVVRRAEAGSAAAPATAPAIVGETVSGGGQPLDGGTQHFMETRFGEDFSGVRVHTGGQAAESARSIQAHAYTFGNHIVFNHGQYAPQTESGRYLLAHELTHVVQQGGQVRRRVSPGASPPAAAAPAPAAAPPAPVPPVPAPSAATAAPAAPAPDGPDAAAAPPPAASQAPAGPDPNLLREPQMSEAPDNLTPAARQRLAQQQQNAADAADAHAALPPEEEQAAGARAAVQEPEAETQGHANEDLVAALGQRPEPSPEIEALCENIRRVIREQRPPDEDSLLQTDPEAAANEAGAQLNESIEGDAQRVGGEYAQLEETPAGSPEQQAQPLETPPEEAGGPAVNGASAAPDPVSAEDVSLDADVERGAAQMEEAGMNTAPAQLVETGPIAEARGAQGELVETAQQDPQAVLAEQDATLDASRGDMRALQEEALNALQGTRTQSIEGAGSQQVGMVGTEEERRTAVSTEANQIFTDAQTQVGLLLEPLSRTAMTMWDSGKTRIATEFEQRLARVQAWIDERHSGAGGAILEVWDNLTGYPDWITDEYNEAEAAFGDSICELIREISTWVNGVILTCEQLIDDANTRINTLFASLPAELAEWAMGEQARFGERLQGLRDNVAETQQNFNRDLAQSAAQAVQEVREQVHALREKAKGALGRLADAMAAFLEDPARAIIDGLLTLVGIEPARFWALINRIGQVIDQIAADPLAFAGNLLSAIGAGFQRFFDNVATHLFSGLIEWLFSGLGAVGVQIPRDLSLPSIITFFLQLMGITWERVRALLARHIGEENVELIEQAYSLVANLIEMGPAGIFEMIKDQLDPQHILDTIIQMAIDFLRDTLITQVTARIIMLFNPVGAIAQAVEAIYRVLKWIFENAARIFSLVETVVGGIADILAGNIGGMAAAVESALARLISPVIDFLAGYMGLGNLPDTIANAVRGLQSWVEGILDRVIGWLAERGRALLSALGLGGAEEGEEGDDLEDEEVGETVRFSAGGENHRLWIDATGSTPRIMMASETEPVIEKLAEWQTQANQDHDSEGAALISQAESVHQTTLEKAVETKEKIEEAQLPEPAAQADEVAETADNQTEGLENELKNKIIPLVERFQEPTVPGAVFVPGFNNTKSTSFEATYVHQTPEGVKNHEEGSMPSRQAMRDTWEVLTDVGVSSGWVKFHIFNENLGGKGVDSNLIPTPRFINNPDYLSRFETPLKNLYNDHKPVWFEAMIEYYSDLPLFVSNYLAIGGAMKYENGNWVKDPQQAVPNYDAVPGKPEQLTIHLNEVLQDESYWEYIINLTTFQERLLIWLKESRPGGTYSNKDEIKAVIDQNVTGGQRTLLHGIVDRVVISFSPPPG